MDEIPPTTLLRPGQRTLAAIVFTDVVSFSARMQAAEERTLKLLQQDFTVMREVCRQHEGTVLKTTGDGLLLYFSSAVQAVACALAMQRYFAEEAKKQAADQTLVHRVGIHLGDVFVSEQDVMGDGVNIAARLQAEAEPGGICISQTVYDVVKNKLELHVTSLGARELKNIAESIQIYRLLIDAQALQTGRKAPAPVAIRVPRNGWLQWWRRPVVRWTGVVLLVLAVVFSIAGVLRARARLERQLAEVAAAHAVLRTALEEGSASAGRDVEEYTRLLNDSRQNGLQIRHKFLEKYDFAGLAVLLRERQVPGATGGQGLPALQKSAEQMLTMQAWVTDMLQNYTQAQPLVVRELTGSSPKELRVFAKSDRLLYFVEGGAVRGRSWSEVKPAWIGAIIVGTLLEARTAPGHEVIQGTMAFARLYGQPEMIGTLRTRKPPAGRN